MRVALYAGSFDPIHLGHLSLIERASATFDRVIVGVLANPDKPSGMFGAQERARFVENATCDLANVSSQQFYGLTVDLATSVGATVLIRAAHKEWGNEMAMAAMNLALAGIPTMLIPADAATRAISSSLVRHLVAAGELAAAKRLVPSGVRAALAAQASSMA